MQKGKIIEEGSHENLLRNYPDGLYAKFVKEQENSETNPNVKLSLIEEVEEEEAQEDNLLRAKHFS